MNILGCVDLWICDIAPNFQCASYIFVPCVRNNRTLGLRIVFGHLIFLLLQGNLIARSLTLHFFEFFLRKNLQNLKCLTYLCIGFRKHPVPTSQTL